MSYPKFQLSSLAIIALSVFSCTPYQNIEVSKSLSGTGSPQTLIYSLPKTRIDITIQVTKTLTKAGPYAAYAEKYLTLSDVPVSDAEAYEISQVKITPVNEPDPEQYYAIAFKTYPANLHNIFSMTQQGLMLDLQESWNAVSREFPSKQLAGLDFGRSIYDPSIEERVDTFYKTILTDASFVKVPIYKKSVQIKNEEDKAKDMANLILKLRKRRLKMMLGEYDYQPDGTALKVIVDELAKEEAELMTNFIGKKIIETTQYNFSFTPSGTASKELIWFNSEKGISESAKSEFTAISFSIILKEAYSSEINGKPIEKTTNNIYFRSPVIAQVNVKTGNSILAEARVPVYQTGKIQLLPVMP